MIYTHKMEDGGFGFGFLGSTDDVKELFDAIKELLDDAVDEDAVTVDEDEVKTDRVPPEELESDHQITVGYDDDTDVTFVTYDPPISEHAVPCALLRAAADLWPVYTDQDKRLKKALHELADMRGELDDVEDSE